MRRWLEFIAGATVALCLLASCDESHHNKEHAKSLAQDRREEGISAALGADWTPVNKHSVSVWRFAGARAQPPTLALLRAALENNSLPSRDAVRPADLLDLASATFPAEGLSSDAGNYRAVLTVTPWNEDTLLLWVEAAPSSGGEPGVSVEFDPASIAAFRPLRDPETLPPAEVDGGARVSTLYELLPQPELSPDPAVRYAVVHLNGIDRPVTAAAFVPSIDDAPGIMRFYAAIAGFGGLLRGDPAVRDLSAADALALAQSVEAADGSGRRAALIDLMRRAEPLIDQPPGDISQPADESSAGVAH